MENSENRNAQCIKVSWFLFSLICGDIDKSSLSSCVYPLRICCSISLLFVFISEIAIAIVDNAFPIVFSGASSSCCPRWRCSFSFYVWRSVHCASDCNLLQVASTMEQFVCMSHKAVLLCNDLGSYHSQYPFQYVTLPV